MEKHARIIRSVMAGLCAAGLIWFLIPIHWHVANPGNLTGIFVCVLLLVCNLFAPKIQRVCRQWKRLRYFAVAFLALFCAGALWSAAMTVCMMTVTAAPPAGATVVVLGSGVRGTSPNADLWERIHTACAYLKAHPEAKCVACGGQGPGEGASEASVIRSCLIDAGIEPGRIQTEETSRSTQENLTNALPIIEKNQLSRSLALVTDDYHEFRACSIARSLGLYPFAVPSKTPWFIFSACWAREILALTKYLLLG
jgi:uncharacterized SAM-binding protein YcdF (DUF218 family)